MVNDLLSQEEIDALLKGSSGEKKTDSAGQDAGLLSEVASIFSAAGERVIGMLSGKTVAVKLTEEAVLSQDDFLSRLGDPSPLLYSMMWEGLEVPAALVLNGRGALVLADLMMGGDGKDLPPEMNDLYLSAAQEGLSQFVGTALADLSRLLSGKKVVPRGVSATLPREEWRPFGEMDREEKIWAVQYGIEINDVGAFDMWFLIPLDASDKLVEELNKAVQSVAQEEVSKPEPHELRPSEAKTEPAPPPRARGSAVVGAGAAPAPVEARPAAFLPLRPEEEPELRGIGNLDLIVDVPLRITVELGRTRKTIGEILNMGPGSVIELEKMAGEPVDILANGKLIARGEVVIIDESFAVRVTEIANKADRIRSISG
jgi:flagellar motor switch protein FliN/FliY